MAYPTGMLSITLEDTDRRLVDVKSFAGRTRATLAAANTGSTTIIDVQVRLRQARAALVAAAAVSGIGAYAQAQKGNATLDVVAEFNGVVSAIDSVVAWIANNFPKDGSGYLLAQTMGADGPVDRTFTPAQTAGLRTALDALIATIA